jgi:phage terminase large subunit-like protein
MHELVEHGRAGDDPRFYFREWAAPAGCAVDDPAAWRAANPALACKDPFLAADALAALVRTTRESTFRLLRLGQWVADTESWLPYGAWAACAHPERIVADGERVVLAFDGSASGDSTAIIGCTLDGHVFTLGVWANPGDARWRVPRGEVDAAVDMAFDRYDVAELACDPWGWRSEIEQWAGRHGERRVIEWPTNVASRMGPATDRIFQAIAEHRLTHDGDSRLAAHVAHCVAKPSPHGDLIVKDRRGSPRKIDAAVAAIVCYDRAAHHANTTKRRRVAAFR